MAASMHGLSKSAPVTAPIISDDYELGFFNCITGYMMSALSTSQSMGLLQVIPGGGKTVRTVMASYKTSAKWGVHIYAKYANT